LVDVPGIPVTVIFTAGCNMDCPYCQNSELIPTDSGVEMSVQEIVDKARGNLTDGYCITGGEPTIHSDLPVLLDHLRNDTHSHINLNTQGSIPKILEQCLPYLDSVWFDFKGPPDRYKEITRRKIDHWPRIQQSIELLLKSDVAFWPRTTYVGGIMTSTDIEKIMQTLAKLGFQGEYVVQNYVESTGIRLEETTSLKIPIREDIESLLDNTPSGISLRLNWR
jgi:pyruvate formate lyase activating enzyme